MKKPLLEWIGISLDTDSLKKSIENKINYSYLYEVFDKYHEMELDPLQTLNCHEDLLKDTTGKYEV